MWLRGSSTQEPAERVSTTKSGSIIWREASGTRSAAAKRALFSKKKRLDNVRVCVCALAVRVPLTKTPYYLFLRFLE